MIHTVATGNDENDTLLTIATASAINDHHVLGTSAGETARTFTSLFAAPQYLAPIAAGHNVRRGICSVESPEGRRGDYFRALPPIRLRGKLTPLVANGPNKGTKRPGSPSEKQGSELQ